MSKLNLNKLLLERRIIFCGGTGGVGKTTTAAALGLLGARLGRRTLVLTIDPARRLANAMGLAALAPTPQPIPGAAGLWAMMLDPASTFDELIERHAGSARDAQAFINNPYYQQISHTVAGSKEFIAMEKIHELAHNSEYDLLIIDTPPSQHALDFIDAPRRLIEMLDGTGLGILLRANNLANRLTFGLAGKGQQQFGKLFEQLTGHKLMLDVHTFFNAFGEIIDGFKARAANLQAVLRSDDAAFVLIMTPASDVAKLARRYAERLKQEHIHIAGAIFNQTHHVAALTNLEALHQSATTCDISEDLWQRLQSCHQQWLQICQTDDAAMTGWRTDTGMPLCEIPRLEHNVSTMDDLALFADALSQT